MGDLEAELERARALSVEALADAIEAIGFECTRCGACCRGDGEEHTATVFPDEVRDVLGDPAASGGDGPSDWRDVARPMPFGLERPGEGDDGEAGPLSGETFEWALRTDDCGDCTFYEAGDGAAPGTCTVYDDRPLICRTYPFSVGLGGTEPMGEVVERVGPVRAHECEGLGRDVDRGEAEDLAAALKARAVREVEEMIAVRDNYEPADPAPGEVVVHDSEGAKRPDGTAYR